MKGGLGRFLIPKKRKREVKKTKIITVSSINETIQQNNTYVPVLLPFNKGWVGPADNLPVVENPTGDKRTSKWPIVIGK